ncbi:hypothetical protein BO71DRAFT_434388 [Aspergillus ellipticus CBS 707.79]|uniref:DUF7580 domain-containing protein n=1 Tax=Aspergillus ellipticus CBS 707.79 TaxID=1448320 RepID=A0A319D5U4_9EURO|nr:hypothetical protein BO71DRAFT_434388 [Aspergillus ellipticus CBS 707.79]
MSGFDVVGVVLGAIPLIVAAIDSYKKTSQRFKYFKYKEPLIVDLIQSLEDQRFFIESDLYLSLKATRLEEDELDDLIRQTSPDLFCDPEIAHDIEQCLGSGYVRYQRAVLRCQEVLTEIASHIEGLASDSQGNLPRLIDAHRSKDGTYEFTKKIKFSLQKDDLEKQIRNLNDATSTLRRIREMSTERMEVTLQTTSQPIAKFTSAIRSVQQHARRLYSAIAAGYIGGCHPVHETRLFLSSRSALWDRKKHLGTKKAVAFTVAFSPGLVNTEPLECYKTDVEVLDEEMDAFSESKEQAQTPTKIFAPPLIKPRGDTHLLQLYLSRGGYLCYFNGPLRPVVRENTVLKRPEDIITLDELLQQTMQSTPSSSTRLTLNQRMGIAVNIVSSIMQLHSTPWLCFPFTSKELAFERSAESFAPGGATQTIGVPQPFIRQNFTHGVDDEAKCAFNPRRCMLDLGILLLELWHAKTFSTYATEEGLSIDNSLGSRYEAAARWLDFSAYHILPFYLDLATRCIECTFATSSVAPDWQDIVFQKSVCEHVLKPLWDNCPAELR